MKWNYTDARSLNSFSRVGYDYLKIKETEEYMIWEMRKNNKVTGYEVWTPKWCKNTDGTTVWAKPSDEDFGKYGWYCPTMAGVMNKINKFTIQE